MNSIFSSGISSAIEKELDDYFRSSIAASLEIGGSYERLWNSLYTLIKSGGKRFRPNITMLSYEIFGGTQPADIISIAAAQELLHFSLLIHDDIIDRDYVRYGVPNIAGRYDAFYQKHLVKDTEVLHFSHGAAILGGDLMLAAAHELIIKSPVSLEQKYVAHTLLTKSIFTVAGGELLDMEASFMPYAKGNALKIALYKTAYYSFVIPLLTGAKLASISPKQEQLLTTYAQSLGVAYQLVDDLLGIFGNEKETGKSVLGDIREGKRTFLVEQAIDTLNMEERAIFNLAFGNPTATPESVHQTKELLIKSKGRQKTEDAVAAYKNTALTAVSQLNLEPHHADKLIALADLVTKRKF